MKAKYKTTEFIATCALSGCVVVILAFIFQVLRYDPEQGHGIAPSIARQTAAAYAPIIGASFIALRDHVFRLVSTTKRVSPTPLRSGVGFVYTIVIAGIAIGLGGVIYLGTIPTEEAGQWALVLCASGWGATIGYAVQRVFTTEKRAAAKE